jgi:hypothetical protein
VSIDIRTQILESEDGATELVEIPEWDVTVEVRSMTAGERVKTLERFRAEGGEVDMGAMSTSAIISCTFDPETDKPVFEEGDAALLMEKAAVPVERLSMKCLRVSGLISDEEDELGKDSSSEALTEDLLST